MYRVLRLLGPAFALRRARLAVDHALGITRRRFAARPWDSIRLEDLVRPGIPTTAEAYSEHKSEHAPPFLFPLGEPPNPRNHGFSPRGVRAPTLEERLKLLSEGRRVYFFHLPSPVSVDWHHNPFSDARAPSDRVWCDIPDFSPASGDARTLWEPSRAAWAIDLARARAYGLPYDAEGVFWTLFDSWARACPPWLGFQWKCGQEAATRLIALSIAFWSLYQRGRTPSQRWVQFAKLAWATGYRIAGHISYAVSQGNNHALSEACGLLLVSHLFPEFRDAEHWNRIGRRVLETQLRRQFHSDGSYVQWSFNYQRVAMQVSMLALRIGELGGRPLDRTCYDTLRTSAEFLAQMMEPRTGELPNYGNNDGAWVLPLSDCSVSDFRPAIQSASFLANRSPILDAGPWDEDMLWLFGGREVEKGSSAATHRPPRKGTEALLRSMSFPIGGYHTLRRGQSWAMLRCHSYRTRPGQYDALHLDLWWNGINILQDTGTFQYYVPGRTDVEEYFRSSRAHNTVQIDGVDPCEWPSRFLHIPWSRCRVRRFEAGGDHPACIVTERYDYDRAPWRVLHRRTVIAPADDLWVIVDDLIGSSEHRAKLFWHLGDLDVRMDEHTHCVRATSRRGDFVIHVSTPSGALERFEVVRGHDDPGEVQGFASPVYGSRVPIPCIVAESSGRFVRFVTVATPGATASAKCNPDDGWEESWLIARDGLECRLRLHLPTREATQTFLAAEVRRATE